jgi:hypothetical protein
LGEVGGQAGDRRRGQVGFHDQFCIFPRACSSWRRETYSMFSGCIPPAVVPLSLESMLPFPSKDRSRIRNVLNKRVNHSSSSNLLSPETSRTDLLNSSSNWTRPSSYRSLSSSVGKRIVRTGRGEGESTSEYSKTDSTIAERGKRGSCSRYRRCVSVTSISRRGAVGWVVCHGSTIQSGSMASVST